MKKFLKARKGGFTLVELLIVTVIIGILAGMMMLTMGSATDGAEATKLLNDLRLVKSAALLYFFDYEEWPDKGVSTGQLGSDAVASLEAYMDKPLAGKYSGGIWVKTSGDRLLYGLSSDKLSTGAIKKLKKNGGVYDNAGNIINAPGVAYVMLR
jgi:general secretion pathway protein G